MGPCPSLWLQVVSSDGDSSTEGPEVCWWEISALRISACAVSGKSSAPQGHVPIWSFTPTSLQRYCRMCAVLRLRQLSPGSLTFIHCVKGRVEGNSAAEKHEALGFVARESDELDSDAVLCGRRGHGSGRR